MINEMGMKARSAVLELDDGASYRMDFDMGMLANAEGVYEVQFGRIVSINEIIGELAQARARAVMAVSYAAMLSAGEKLSWERFAKKVYTFENYSKISGVVADAVVAMMRGGEDDSEDDQKNAPSRGGD